MGKRFYWGIYLLILLFLLSVLAGIAMDRIYRPMSRELARAAQLAMDGRMPQAQSAAQQAQDRWYRFRSFTAVLADQTPADEGEMLFEQILVFARTRDMPHFAACCRELSRLCRAMADAHRIIPGTPHLLKAPQSPVLKFQPRPEPAAGYCLPPRFQ